MAAFENTECSRIRAEHLGHNRIWLREDVCPRDILEEEFRLNCIFFLVPVHLLLNGFIVSFRLLCQCFKKLSRDALQNRNDNCDLY